jgi:hypothetical protein
VAVESDFPLPRQQPKPMEEKLKSAVKMGSQFCSRLPYKKLSMFIKVLQDSLRENIQTVLLKYIKIGYL